MIIYLHLADRDAIPLSHHGAGPRIQILNLQLPLPSPVQESELGDEGHLPVARLNPCELDLRSLTAWNLISPVPEPPLVALSLIHI